MADVAQNSQYVVAQLRRWLEAAVIGLDLCPFASGPWQAGRVRIEVSWAKTFEHGVRDVMEQVVSLTATSPEQLSSTLVVFPDLWQDFDGFLDAIEAAEHLLISSGADEVVQLAHFHPRYVFESAEEGAYANYSNRSPYPIFHLLRVDEVWRALESFGDGLTIAEANIRKLEAMQEGVVALWASFMPERER